MIIKLKSISPNIHAIRVVADCCILGMLWRSTSVILGGWLTAMYRMFWPSMQTEVAIWRADPLAPRAGRRDFWYEWFESKYIC